MMLNRHHRHIVAFLRVRDIQNAPGARRKANRLVVEYPVADVLIALFRQNVGCIPGLSKSRPEPTSRTAAGEGSNDISGLYNVFPLVRNLLHILLGKTVPNEFPAPVEGGTGNR